MEETFTDTEEMDGYEEDVLYSLMAGSAAAVFRPRPPAVTCNCSSRIDELTALVRELLAEVRGRS